MNEVNTFTTIRDLYDYLDEHAYILEKDMEITDPIIAYRNKTDNGGEKQMTQWDLECFLFQILRNTIFCFSTSNGKDPGEIFQYPTLDDLQNKAFDYVKGRAIDAKNPLIKATYNHLLWKAPFGMKDRIYAMRALDNYFKCIEWYLSVAATAGDDENTLQLIGKFERMAALSMEVNYRRSELRILAANLLFNVPFLMFFEKEAVLTCMLDFPYIFKPVDFDKTLLLYEEVIKDPEMVRDNLLANVYLKTAIRIGSKTSQNIKRWHNEIGECFLRMAADDKGGDDRAMILQSYYSEAVMAFRQAGNKAKKIEAELLHDKIKQSVKLSEVPIVYDATMRSRLSKWHDQVKIATGKLLKQEPDYIYDFIGKGAFFPSKEFITKSTDNVMEPWLAGIRVLRFDINKNIRAKGKGEEVENEAFWQGYMFEIRQSILPYLHYVFIPGIESGKLTYKNFIDYLTTNTWLGQSYSTIDIAGKEKAYNWISLIAPAITEYFIQMHAALLHKPYQPNFMLCIDSLTLKIEGLLRDFSYHLSGSTSKGSAKGVQVKFINDLLQDEIVRQHFNEDDLLFFDFLFVNKSGFDLRNNIAHCFYRYDNYGYDLMHLLMAALLRIGKYTFELKTE